MWPEHSLTIAPASATCEARTLVNYMRGSTAVHERGCIIAANAEFTCYALRNGLIRAIHRESEATALLRGLAQAVGDMRFCPGHNLVAAVSIDGAAYAWRLSATAGNVTCAKSHALSSAVAHPPLPSHTAPAGARVHRRSETVLSHIPDPGASCP